MISIIIPVYNSAQYLSRCIECVFNQTHTDWELIFVDDGSTDGSQEICDEVAKKNGQTVCVIHQRNQGASVARKVGIDHSRGEWLTFIDSDDIVEDGYLARLYHAMTQYGVKIAACDQIKHQEGKDLIVDKSGEMMLLDDQAIHDRFFNYQFWGFWGKIYHKSVFEDIYFPKYTINEDYVVMAQLFDRYKQMAYVPIGLYHYMTHGESLSHQKLSKRMFDEYYNKLWVRDFYAQRNPKYLKNAEAQLTETCIKLIRTVKQEDVTGEYCEVEAEMLHYVQSHIVSILFNPHLKNGLKLQALKL
jgi:glycosyltransferase involved in cell wall biosynthesis